MILGCRLCKAAWNRGYATEGAQALICKGFSELRVQRIVATTFEDNLASRRVLEKLGMKIMRRFRMTTAKLSQLDIFHPDATQIWDG